MIGRKRLWPNLGFYPAFSWGDCGKPQKNSVKITEVRLRDMKQEPPEYKA